MTKYLIILLQIIIFYIFPVFASTEDTIGLVLLILLSTFILSIIAGIILKNKIKYIYPIIVSLLFLPSILIYYNESALIHSVWYFIDSLSAILIITLIKKIL